MSSTEMVPVMMSSIVGLGLNSPAEADVEIGEHEEADDDGEVDEVAHKDGGSEVWFTPTSSRDGPGLAN